MEYNSFLKEDNNITIANFRLMNTNDLIKRVYQTIKNKNSNIIFSISPDVNI